MHSSTVNDLSQEHFLVSELFKWPVNAAEWEPYRLSEDQVRFFHEFGFLSGIKLLNEEQIKYLNDELEEIMDPAHPGNHLFHEFHSNESSDKNKVLFHALGAWRIKPGFHD